MRCDVRQIVTTGFSLLLAFLLWRHPVIRRSESEPHARSFGRFTEKEIFDRSEEIVSLLAPQASQVQMLADPHLSYVHLRRHREDPVRHWMVTCTGAAGQELVDLDWNAETGALLQAVPASRQTPTRRPVSLSQHQATEVAQAWLETLKIGGAGLRWRPARPATCAYQVWSIVWQCGEHRAWVTLRARTGALIEAASW
ncbi:MAG TPA: hypothetical protein VKT32_03370 [Chthonomonadaceae bacterium]|nr:hypothetical protein [Chthonomonadaceae bacterium]